MRMIKAVPRSGCTATIKNRARETNKGIMELIIPIVFWAFNLWKYLAIKTIKAILANSDTCKLKPPTLIHLFAPIPV